jgi:small subunit ribosomal protein S2
MKDLLEAGAHFGHKVSRWNPKMKKFIFGEKNGIYIIDLQKTVKQLERAYNEVVENVRASKTVLFVGTKRQAQDIVREEAMRCGAFYICERWLGGMLTNFRTIRRTIERLLDYDRKKESGMLDALPKKERLSLARKMEKMEKILGGVKTIKSLPDLVFVIDIKREYIAVHEANILGIPVIAIVDTNTDPDLIATPIPANDDAIRSIKLVTSIIAQAVVDGKHLAESEKVSVKEQQQEKEILEDKKKDVKKRAPRRPVSPKAKDKKTTKRQPKGAVKTATSTKKAAKPATSKDEKKSSTPKEKQTKSA